MVLQEAELLRQLVRVPSVNPDFATDGSGGEGQLTDFLQNLLDELGWRWLRQTVHPGRDNLIALCPGKNLGPGRSSEATLWEVHQDTVGVAGMTIDPFSGEPPSSNLAEGRIWGRGACDIKGGMAAMLTALSRAQVDPDQQQSTVLLALTVNEESGFTGADALCRFWSDDPGRQVSAAEVHGPLSLAELQDLRPRQAVIAEPTGLDVVVAHKGASRWHCHTRGQAAHTSQPELGRNAIYAMADVLHSIEAYHEEELARGEPHPLCGRPAVCASTIQGGSGVNVVPDHAVIAIDRRLLPGESPRQAYDDLVAFIEHSVARAGIAIENEQPWIECHGLDDSENRAWAGQIAAVAHSLDLPCELIGVPYGTDASVIAANGIPSVVFGPGSIDQAHTKDEWLEIDQLAKATEILYRLVCCEDASGWA